MERGGDRDPHRRERRPLRQRSTPGQQHQLRDLPDGFTLHDLVSYDRKHNEATLEHGHNTPGLWYDAARLAVAKPEAAKGENMANTMKAAVVRELAVGSCKSAAAVASLLAIIGMLPGTQVRADEASFADFPYVIYCEYEGIQHAYYFSQFGPDGRAIYLTPDRQAGAITIDGVAERIGGERSGSCVDKTLDDLRSSGQAFDLPR